MAANNISRDKQKEYTLSVHDTNFSADELILNPEHFPKAKIGDLFVIYHPENPLKKVLLRVPSLNAIKGNVQISISKYIAGVFELSSMKKVLVETVKPESVFVEFIELSFKDQNISRSDMWRLKVFLQNTCVYIGKLLTYSSIRATVKDLVGITGQATSGYITDKTKFIFRSRSANMIALFQMSKEMWEFADDGDLYFEKAANTFMKELFDRWNTLSSNHSLTIVFTSRVYYDNTSLAKKNTYSSSFQGSIDWSPVDPISSSFSKTAEFMNTDADGRRYQDYFKVVCVDVREYNTVILALKAAFKTYPDVIDWHPYQLSSVYSTPNREKSGTNSSASESNLLESINLALHIFDKRRYIDRDLSLTGELIIVVTAGIGTFEVDSQLASDTKEKMMEYGIGCDIISVARPPMHNVPLFKYKNRRKEDLHKSSYDFPYWIHMSFYDPKGIIKKGQQEKRWVPTCRMPEAAWTLREYQELDQETFVVPVDVQYQSNQDVQLTATATKLPYSLSTSSFDESAFSQQQSLFGSVKKSYSESERNPNIFDLNNGTPTSAFGSNVSNFLTDGVDDPRRRSNSMDNAPLKNSASTTDLEELAESQTPLGLRKKDKTVAPDKKPVRKLNPIATVAEMNALQRRSSRRRRWMHLFYRTGEATYTNTYPYPPNWKSLCEPASLPLTTDYFPSATELNKMYTEYNTIISLIPDENIYQNNTEELLRELISQRLAQGYQLVISSEQDTHITTDTATKKRFSLSVGHDYHQLTYDESGQNIEIKRYLYKQTLEDKPKPFSYNFKVWPLHHDGFVSAKVDVPYEAASSFPWNYLDNLVCGYYSDLIESLKYMRIRFVVVPNISQYTSLTQIPQLASKDEKSTSSEKLQPTENKPSNIRVSEERVEYLDPVVAEQKAVAAFTKFKTILEGMSPKKQKEQMEVTIVQKYETPATASTPQSSSRSLGTSKDYGMDKPEKQASDTALTSSVTLNTSGENTVLSPTLSLRDAATANTAAPPATLDISNRAEVISAMQKGLKIDDRRHHMRTYKKCFIGSECVDWFLKNTQLTSREEIVKFCQSLMNDSVIEHVVDRKDFKDGHYFYRFVATKPQEVSKEEDGTALSTFSTDTPPTSNSVPIRANTNTPTHTPGHTPSHTPIITPIHSNTSLAVPEPPPKLDKTLRIDLDTKTSRPEWISLKYDSVFNYFQGYYHVEVDWIIGTGCVVEDFVSNLQRKVKMAGVSILQVPIDKTTNVFLSPLRISVSPKFIPMLRQNSAFVQQITSKFEFIQESDEGYIHRYALAFLSVTEGGFTWYFNMLASSKPYLAKAQALAKEFVELCSNPTKLQAIVTDITPHIDEIKVDDLEGI